MKIERLKNPPHSLNATGDGSRSFEATKVKVVCELGDGVGWTMEAEDDGAGNPIPVQVHCDCDNGYIPAHLIPGTEFCVTDEAWEAAVLSLCKRRNCSDQNDEQHTDTDPCRRCDAEAIVADILTALLGHAPMRVVAVGEMGLTVDGPALLLKSGLRLNITGRRVALLAEDGEKPQAECDCRGGMRYDNGVMEWLPCTKCNRDGYKP